ncbi:ABC transporter substrate-binding protein [Pseudoroseicyclus aestuarii]|uniref:Carbohydrate ABC transporter substrate-binding protein (CUT1 family) n=1 Tax=Pseudoroseicyclus aestuarii TaxID=1795041 RepID=A0A318SS50_9RHOB|nr:extracellular solute-binding protein [Pseudoroseicyclus aestuarii]PYE81339.1 carbohydrate ABC transporter substrate-binding protein (CUT1 family) [Pseudoroseicyclus aestuarii]
MTTIRTFTTRSLAVSAAALIAGAAAAQDAPGCGTEPVELNAYFETGFPLPSRLAEAFTAQFPDVTFDIREDQFANLMENSPRLLSQPGAPDLIRLPSISDLVANDLLLNLDPYYDAYGWDAFPEGNLVQIRVADGGRPRGVGSLYAMGLNYSLTGVFYNAALAEQIGMTEAPQTLEELDALLAAAKEAGVQPIVQWNKDTGGLAFPLQNLMGSYGDPEPINAWIFQQEGATIDTPENLQAAEHLQGWVEAGYFTRDANALDYFTMMSRFTNGQGLFMFNGDWESANLEEQMGDDVGFFLMPPLEEGGRQATMSSPLTFGIGANAAHPDCAAAFLNWVATDPEARQLNVEIGGSNPGGPADMALPEVNQDSLIAETLEAGQVIAADDGAMDFIANATGAIFAAGWTPELQKLVGGVQDAEGLLDAVQDEYETQLSR